MGVLLHALNATCDVPSVTPPSRAWGSLHFTQHPAQQVARGVTLFRSQRENYMSDSLSADCTIAVIKIGGSILKNARAYRRAARYVRNRHAASPDERLVVVVSAQEGVTDWLAATACQVVAQPNPSALDLLWSTGELRSVALLALHLQALGVSAVPLNIHEAGLAIADTTRTGHHPARCSHQFTPAPICTEPAFSRSRARFFCHRCRRGGSFAWSRRVGLDCRPPRQRTQCVPLRVA